MKLSLKQRFLLVIILIILLSSSSIFILVQNIIRDVLKKQFLNHINFLANHFSSSITLSLLLKDQDMIDHLAKSLLKEESISKIEVYDLKETLIYSLFISKSIDGSITRDVVIKSPDPLMEIKRIGKIKIYYSVSKLNKLIRHILFQILLLIILISISVGIVGYLLIVRSFLLPFSSLMNAIREVSQKNNLSVAISGKGLPELEQLAISFKEMLNSLLRNRRELEKTYNEMMLNKTMAEIGQFSLVIAHEIKNPLGIIKGSLDILKKRDVSDDIKKEMIVFIEEEILRLDKLIKDFLSFARPQKIVFKKINLVELFDDLIKILQLEYGNRIHLEIREDIPDILGDYEQLKRAFLNIIKNSFEANANKVVISLSSDNDRLICQIKDNGSGIDSNDLNKIFIPFYSKKKKGTGLGLSIVRQILIAHKAKIEVSSERKHGTIFKIIFPLDGGENGKYISGR